MPAPAPAGATREAEQEVRFLASRKSTVYHRPNCRYIRQIKPENLIGFKSTREAERAGYRPCKVCRP